MASVSGISRWFRALALGTLAAGVGTNGIYTYQQTQTKNKLNEQVAERTVAIEELGKSLTLEKETNQSQAAQMSRLDEELQNNKANALNFFQKLDQEHLRTSQLTKELSALKSDLGERITLDQMTEAVDKIKFSSVIVEGEEINPFTGQSVRGNGSGVILIGENGGRYILTNAHVTEGHEIRNNQFKDGVYHIKVYNGTDYEKPVEFDAPPVILANGKRAFSKPRIENDLALLAIPPDVKLPPGSGITLRDINKHPLKVGEPVILIASPFGVRDFVSIGSISHIDREIKDADITHHVMADLVGAPGSSGGGLCTVRAEDGKPVVELIGIHDWGWEDNIGANIRVDYIQKVLKDWGIELQKK